MSIILVRRIHTVILCSFRWPAGKLRPEDNKSCLLVYRLLPASFEFSISDYRLLPLLFHHQLLGHRQDALLLSDGRRGAPREFLELRRSLSDIIQPLLCCRRGDGKLFGPTSMFVNLWKWRCRRCGGLLHFLVRLRLIF